MRDRLGEVEKGIDARNACAAWPHVEVDQHAYCAARTTCSSSNSRESLACVEGHTERAAVGEVGHSACAGWIDGRVGDQDVGRAIPEGREQRFGFANLGHREADGASGQLAAGNLQRLMGFGVGPNADAVAAAVVREAGDVQTQPLAIHQQCRRWQRVDRSVDGVIHQRELPDAETRSATKIASGRRDRQLAEVLGSS